MRIKLFDSELKVMELLWASGAQSAKALAQQLADQVGWNKNTTYTVIKKCIEKDAIRREEPGFICHALITREEAQAQEVDALVDRMFGGSVDLLFASLLENKQIPQETIDRLRRQIEEGV